MRRKDGKEAVAACSEVACKMQMAQVGLRKADRQTANWFRPWFVYRRRGVSCVMRARQERFKRCTLRFMVPAHYHIEVHGDRNVYNMYFT